MHHPAHDPSHFLNDKLQDSKIVKNRGKRGKEKDARQGHEGEYKTVVRPKGICHFPIIGEWTEHKPSGIDRNSQGNGKHLCNEAKKRLNGRNQENPCGYYGLQDQAPYHHAPVNFAAVGTEQIGDAKNPKNAN